MDPSNKEPARPSTLHGPDFIAGTHYRGYLPHRKVEGATYFVTFRLAGSLPQTVLDAYRHERDAIVARAAQFNRPLSGDEQQRLQELHSERIERYLDAGIGECWLAQPDIARVVATALRYFEGERYELYAWVVMPNHVHAVFRPLAKHTLSAILHSWKSYTGVQANRLLGRSGESFWESESYDHVMRDLEDFARWREYTINNPAAANLCSRPEAWPYSSAYMSYPADEH